MYLALAATFIFSAILNYLLARVIVTTEPFVDQNAFNEKLE